LTKTYAGTNDAVPGGTVAFDFEVCNNGNRQATNVVLVDTYTAQMTPQRTCDDTNRECTVQLANIAAGGCVTRRLTYTLISEVDCTLSSISVPASVTEDCSPSSDDASAIFGINASPVFTIDKVETTGNTARPGEVITYAITFSNTGRRIANNVVITEDYPDFTTPVANQDGWNCQSNNLCTYSYGTLAPSDGPETVEFSVTVIDPIPSNVDDLTNTAVISSAMPCAATAETSEETLILANPDLMLTKTRMTQQPSEAGSVVTFQFDVMNLGDVASADAVITDTIPQYLEFDSSLNMGWSCTGQVCEYDLGSVAPSNTATTVTLNLRVAEPLPCGVESVTNTASVSDDGSEGDDTDMTNNSDDESVTLSASVSLQLTVSAAEQSVNAGEEICFDAVGRNAGNRIATNVRFGFIVPEYTTFSGAGYNCVVDNNGDNRCTSTTTIASLSPADSDVERRVCFTVDSTLPAGVDSTEFTGVLYEVCENDEDTDAVSVIVIAAPDIKVCKSGQVAQITYDIDVFNHGSRGAEDATIVENVPEGTTFNAQLSDPRWECDDNGSCTLNMGEIPVNGAYSARFVVDVTADLEAECQTFDNTAVAQMSNGPDLNPNDNDDSVTFTVCPGDQCQAPEPSECICTFPPVVLPACTCIC